MPLSGQKTVSKVPTKQAVQITKADIDNVEIASPLGVTQNDSAEQLWQPNIKLTLSHMIAIFILGSISLLTS
jgi:hypothetical protein